MPTKPRAKKAQTKEQSFSSVMQQYFFESVPLDEYFSSLRYDIKPQKLVNGIKSRIPGAVFQNIDTVLKDLVDQYDGGTYSLFIEAFHGTTGEKIGFTKVENINLIGQNKNFQPVQAPAPAAPAQNNDSLEFMKLLLQQSKEDRARDMENMRELLKTVVSMKAPAVQKDNSLQNLKLAMKLVKGIPFDEDDSPEIEIDDQDESSSLMKTVEMISGAIAKIAPLAKSFMGNNAGPETLPPEIATNPQILALIKAAREHPELLDEAQPTNAIDITDNPEENVTLNTPG